MIGAKVSLLLVINHLPYDGDVVWNALRLARTALDDGLDVRLFLMNDGVDLARTESRPPEAEFDLEKTVIIKAPPDAGKFRRHGR